MSFSFNFKITFFFNYLISVLMKSVMSWNYDDFSIADHRVQLFCELSIFKEPEEDLLIIAKVLEIDFLKQKLK